jgi:hypothetical protein
MPAMTTTARRRFTVPVHASRRTLGAARRLLPAAAAFAVSFGSGAAPAAAQPALTNVKSLQCTFTRQAAARWTNNGGPEIDARPSSLVLRFEAIDADTGTAQLRNGAMTTEITVRLAGGYLHLMQSFRTGPLYTTTVFEAGGSAGAFKAVHSRHELFATPLPGATSSPEQFYGTCKARQ